MESHYFKKLSLMKIYRGEHLGMENLLHIWACVLKQEVSTVEHKLLTLMLS